MVRRAREQWVGRPSRRASGEEPCFGSLEMQARLLAHSRQFHQMRALAQLRLPAILQLRGTHQVDTTPEPFIFSLLSSALLYPSGSPHLSLRRLTDSFLHACFSPAYRSFGLPCQAVPYSLTSTIPLSFSFCFHTLPLRDTTYRVQICVYSVSR
jgi:hypothetical protein